MRLSDACTRSFFPAPLKSKRILPVAVLAVIAVFAMLMLSACGSSTPEEPKDTTQAVKDAEYAYYQHTIGYMGYLPEHFLYVDEEDVVVALQGGEAIGVYSSREEALQAMIDSPDLDCLIDTGDGKLFSYERTPGSDGDDMLSILAIGNSFSMDAMEYVADIALSIGVKEVHIGNMFVAGCNLENHVNFASSNAAVYHFFLNENGTWNKSATEFPETAGDTSLIQALRSHDWDYVTLQQASGGSGKPSTYNGDLDFLINFVQDNAPNAELVWHMTWAYQGNSNHPDFSYYGKNQNIMYKAILDTVKDKICTNDAFTAIIPSATAVQNARSSKLGDTITLDGYHMSRPFGRYLTALMIVKTLSGRSIDNVTFLPDGMTEEQRLIAIEAVNNAAAKPFEMTKSTY